MNIAKHTICLKQQWKLKRKKIKKIVIFYTVAEFKAANNLGKEGKRSLFIDATNANKNMIVGDRITMTSGMSTRN